MSAENMKNEEQSAIDDKEIMPQEQISDDLKKPVVADVRDFSRCSHITELSDDYVIQMMKNLNDRENALYDGVFLASEKSSQVFSNEADKQSLLPIQETLISNESKDDDNIKLDVIEKYNEHKSIDEGKINKPDLLPSEELLTVDKSNNSNNKVEIEKEDKTDNSCNPSILVDDSNRNPDNQPKSTESKKTFYRNKLRTESDTIIDNITHFSWLKPGTQELKNANQTRLPCKSLIESITKEVIENTKLASKSNRKRSGQSKNRKTKAADACKQNSTADRNRRSSNDSGSSHTSKSESGNFGNSRSFEKSTESRSNPFSMSGRTSIGRGRNDRCKIALGDLQTREQTIISDQSNKTDKCFSGDNLANVVEENFSKNEVYHRAQDFVLKKEESAEDLTQICIISADIIKPKEEACLTKVDAKLQDVASSCNKPSVENTFDHVKLPTQEDKGDTDIKKEQLPSREVHKENENTTIENLSIRPIFGRITDASNSGKKSSFTRGFGPNKDEAIKTTNQASQSNKGNLNRFSDQTYRNQNKGIHNVNKMSQSVSKEESYSYKSNNYSNTYDQDSPRWHHQVHTNKPEVKTNDTSVYKSHTASYTSNKHRNVINEKKENEESFIKNQGFNDNNSGSKGYSDRYQNNRTSVGRYSDKNQDYNNYPDRYSSRHQDSKAYHEDYNRPLTSRRDTYYDNNHKNRGFGDRYFDASQNKSYGNTFSDRYTDNQQHRNSSDRIYSKKQDEKEPIKKSQDSSNRSSVGFDRSENCTNHAVAKSLDSSGKNQGLRDRNNAGPNTTNVSYQPVNNDHSFSHQDVFDNSQYSYNLCQTHKMEHDLKFAQEQTDWKTEEQYKSDVKSQKHYDNTQQIQTGLAQVQEPRSIPSDTCQQQLPSSANQNIKIDGVSVQLPDMSKSQPQADNWNSYASVNMSSNSVAANEYNLQYNQALFNSQNQYNTLTPGQKPNVVMSFEGNQNVQRTLGLDPRIANQHQSSQVNNINPSNSVTNSSISSAQMYPPEHATQFFQSDFTNSSMAYMKSSMNVNAQPFEVTNQSIEDSNIQQMYTIQPSHGQTVMDTPRMNEISNNSEEFLKLLKEVSKLSKKLALKQAQLLAVEVKLFKTAVADNAEFSVPNRQASPVIPPVSNNQQLVQEPNESLSANYSQVKHPTGFGDLSLNAQSSQMNSYKMLTNLPNIQNYTSDNLPLNSVSEAKLNIEPVYLAKGNIYQQPTANYQMYADKNSAAYINMVQRAKQEHISRSADQLPKQ